MIDPLNYTPYYDLNLCDALIANGWQVEWMTSPYMFEAIDWPAHVPVRNVFLRHASAVIDRLSWIRRSRPIRSAIKAFFYPFDLLRLDREMSARPAGILHVQWALLPMVDALFWKRWQKRGWRIVYTAHDVDGLDGTTPKLLIGANQRLFRIADAVAAHSGRDCGRIAQLGAPASRVRRIPQGTPGIFTPVTLSRDDARRELGLDPERPTILFFGLLKAYKSLETLLSAMVLIRSRVPNVLLLIAGESLTPHGHYSGLIARLGLADAVRWDRGFIPTARVAAHFAAADVVALPYRAASSSAVLLNAFAHARPVVATAVGAFPEMIDHGKTGLLVSPEAPPELADALVSVLLNPDLARAMGEQARAYAAAHHEWPLIGQATSDIYMSISTVAGGLEDDHDFASLPPFAHVTKRLGRVLNRIAPIDRDSNRSVGAKLNRGFEQLVLGNDQKAHGLSLEFPDKGPEDQRAEQRTDSAAREVIRSARPERSSTRED